MKKTITVATRFALTTFIIAMGFALTIMLFKTLHVSENVRIADESIPNNNKITPNNPIQEPSILSKAEALGVIKKQELKDILYYLASEELEGRMSGKQGYAKSADKIEELCKKWGLKTERQRFSIRQVNPGPKNETGNDWTENVFAYIEGTDPALKDEVVVVGAHLDHIGYGPSMARDRRIAVHPGADDNASGSVCLLGIAKAFSKLGPQPRTIVFQWYSAEEMGLIGSRYYCNNPTFPKENPSIRKHIAMINMDMVGRLNSGVYSVGFWEGNSSIDLSRYIQELNNVYPFANKITSRGGGGSDHASFYNKRIPVAFLHTGLHDDYHRTTDTADKINYDGVERISKYAFELAYKVVHADTRPQFNHADFKPMDYVHDHGHDGVEFIHPWHVDEWHNHTHDHNHSHKHN